MRQGLSRRKLLTPAGACLEPGKQPPAGNREEADAVSPDQDLAADIFVNIVVVARPLCKFFQQLLVVTKGIQRVEDKTTERTDKL